MKLLAVFVLALVACESGIAPQAPTVVTKTVEIAVSKDGRELGTIRIEPGAIGTLTLAPDAGPSGVELAEQWKRITDGEPIALSLDSRKPNGDRVYYSQVTKPSDPSYADQVKLWLEYERYYDVK